MNITPPYSSDRSDNFQDHSPTQGSNNNLSLCQSFDIAMDAVQPRAQTNLEQQSRGVTKNKKFLGLQIDTAEANQERNAKPNATEKKKDQETPKFGSTAKTFKLPNPDIEESPHAKSNYFITTEQMTEANDAKTELETVGDEEQVKETQLKHMGFSSNIRRGLQLMPYLRNPRVFLGNKLFYLLTISMIISSIGVNISEFSTYARNKCSNPHFDVGMYFNIFALFLAKIGLCGYITAECNASVERGSKFPFLTPIIITGILANFQLPLVLFDYQDCEHRSPMIPLFVGFIIVNIIAILAGAVFLSFFVGRFIINKYKENKKFIAVLRGVVSFITFDLVLGLNILFLVVTFSQIDRFSPTLLVENIIFWGLILSGIIVDSYQRAHKETFMPFEIMEIEDKFREIITTEGNKTGDMPLQSEEFRLRDNTHIEDNTVKDQTTGDQASCQRDLDTTPPKLSDRSRKSFIVIKRNLEKIEENEEEFERSGSKVQHKKNQEEGGFNEPVTFAISPKFASVSSFSFPVPNTKGI